jgi:hypothetical protein
MNDKPNMKELVYKIRKPRTPIMYVLTKSGLFPSVRTSGIDGLLEVKKLTHLAEEMPILIDYTKSPLTRTLVKPKFKK